VNILIIDDEKNIRESLARLLELEGYRCQIAEHALTAQEMLEARTFSCILLDLRMPDIDGMQLLDWIGRRGISSPVIMMSAHGEIRDAVSALQIGARDYLVKPFEVEELLIRMKRVIDAHVTEMRFRAGVMAHEGPPEMPDPGASSGRGNPAVRELRRIIAKAAPTESTVLITGESGTGKEVTARQIHAASKRIAGPFVPVNIAGLPENLLESELFGYEKGAFTGAEKLTRGIFEAAEGGTVFLDEIGEMSLSLQAKLLRVLQERRIRRVGAVNELAVDVRILAATNRDLEAMVAGGSFREDLFYRLNVVRITLPPLRERREDIPELTGRLLARISRKLNRPVPEMDPRVLEALSSYPFPGNIRELENLLERALILSEGEHIGPEDFPGISPAGANERSREASSYALAAPTGGPFDGSMKDIERRAIAVALERHGGNRSHSAAQLGISRKTLITKIREYGLE
jgi:two-component system response regulator AtoC